jgi:hypothetical protein
MRRWLAFVALTAAFVVLSAAPVAGEDSDPYTAVFKFAGEQFAKQFGSFIYRTQCQGKEPTGAGGVICGAVGSFSGDAEREWKENVTKQLAGIAAGVARIEAGLLDVRADQQRLLQQNAQVLIRLDEIIGETVAAPAIARIRTLWDEQYAPMIQGKREFSRERVTAFANQVVFQDRVHDQLGQIHDTLARGQIGGKAPLLRLYTQRIAARLGDVSRADLETPYDFLESVLTELLTEQRKGEIMYLWAASILQAECEVQKKCVQLPHTAVEYESVFADHVEAQLAEFNAALEWLVLAGSAPHARRPDFLHKDAARVFASADLLTAANLGRGFGLRGRVIALGDSFDGKLSVAGQAATPARAASLVPSSEGRLDWWKATGNQPAYDEVRFADVWKVYPYHLPKVQPGSYQIATALPWKPANISVGRIDLATGASAAAGASGENIVPFGSFVALGRAGGGYAFMSSEWVAEFPGGGRSVTAVGDLEGDLSKPDVDARAPHVKLNAVGRIKWSLGQAGKDQHVEGTVAALAVRKRPIVSPDGGELTLHVALGDTWDALCPDHSCVNPEINSNTVIHTYTDFSKSAGNDRSARIDARAAVIFGKEGDNGVIWSDEMRTDSAREAHLRQDGPKSARVKLPAGKATDLALQVTAKLDLQTSGIDSSRFWILSVMRPDNIWLTY